MSSLILNSKRERGLCGESIFSTDLADEVDKKFIIWLSVRHSFAFLTRFLSSDGAAFASIFEKIIYKQLSTT